MGLNVVEPVKDLISVLIPNWNGAVDTLECLETLVMQDYGAARLEIIIVENGSQDDSVTTIRNKLVQVGDAFHRYELIEFKENKGIAVAYNRALESVSAEAVALLRLDNDVLLPSHAVSRLMAKLRERDDVAVVGCRIISYDTSPRRAHHYGALQIGWWSGKMRLSFPDSDVACDGVAGCAMLIRKEAIQRLSCFFNPNLFLANELDLCQRIRGLGWKVYYTPAVQIFHKGARSTSKRSEFVRFETAKAAYLFHLQYNRAPALIWYLVDAVARAVVKWVLGDNTGVRALRQAWTEILQVRRGEPPHKRLC